jgi:uncharacterized protein (DUF697 family)
MTTKAEQATLIEELTTKLQETEIELATSSIQSQHEAAQSVVNSHVIAGMSLGLLPIPLLDIAALAGAQLNMLRSLSKHYKVDFDDQVAKAALNSLTTASLPIFSTIGLSSFAKIIPGIGTIVGGISVSVLSGATVYASGQVFIKHFEAGGTFDDFNSKQWLTYFKEQFNEGKLFVQNQYKKSKSSIGKGLKNSKSYLDSVKNKFVTSKKLPEDSDQNNDIAEKSSEENITVDKVAA